MIFKKDIVVLEKLFKLLLVLSFSFSSSFFRALLSSTSMFFWVTHIFLYNFIDDKRRI